MRIIYAVVVENGIKKRTPLILEDRKCRECGKVFSPYRQTSTLCSLVCQRKAENKKNASKYRERAKKWYQENIEKARKRRKQYYWSNPELCREKTRQYWKERREEKRQKDLQYKDETRHRGVKATLIKENGLICSECGVEVDGFYIDAHHVSGNKTDHGNQGLLCKSCHAKTHGLGKRIGRHV